MFRIEKGSKILVSDSREFLTCTTSRTETNQPSTSTRLKPQRSARSLLRIVGVARAARAAWASPHFEDASNGAAAALVALLGLVSPFTVKRFSSHPPTRHIVIGTRKNCMRAKRKIGKRFPWLSVASAISLCKQMPDLYSFSGVPLMAVGRWLVFGKSNLIFFIRL